MYHKYFKDNEQLLEQLERLHQRKYELKRLLLDAKNVSNYVVEFSGLPRTGKTSSVDRIYEFFKQAGFSLQIAQEPAQIIKRNFSKEELSQMTNLDFNNATLEISRTELDNIISQGPVDIILQDRGIIDNYFWYQMMYEEGVLDSDNYNRILSVLPRDFARIDQLFVMSADPKVIVCRDYLNQLWLEPRVKTTEERVRLLKKAFDHLLPTILQSALPNQVINLDTSSISEMQTSIIIADEIINGMSRKLTSKQK